MREGPLSSVIKSFDCITLGKVHSSGCALRGFQMSGQDAYARPVSCARFVEGVAWGYLQGLLGVGFKAATLVGLHI